MPIDRAVRLELDILRRWQEVAGSGSSPASPTICPKVEPPRLLVQGAGVERLDEHGDPIGRLIDALAAAQS
jgi:hypothetical protein